MCMHVYVHIGKRAYHACSIVAPPPPPPPPATRAPTHHHLMMNDPAAALAYGGSDWIDPPKQQPEIFTVLP